MHILSLPFSNQWKGQHGRRNYFMTNLREVEPATVCIPGGRRFDVSDGSDPLSLPIIFKTGQSVAQNRRQSFFFFNFLTKDITYFGILQSDLLISDSKLKEYSR